MSVQYLMMNVAGHRYGVDFEAVEEIVDRGFITALPQLPPALAGVVDIRGRAVPAIDLGVLAGDAPRRDHRSIVVVSDGQRPMALLIDGVDHVADGDSAETMQVVDVGTLLEVVGR